MILIITELLLLDQEGFLYKAHLRVAWGKPGHRAPSPHSTVE